MEKPDTFEDFAPLLRAFKKADLGANGFSGWDLGGTFFFHHIYMNWTGAWEWGKVDGKYVHNYVRDEYKDWLKWFHGLYAEGLIDPESFIGGNLVKDKVASGQSGLVTMNCAPHEITPVHEAMKKNNPDAEIEFLIPPPKGPAGRYNYQLDSAYFTLTTFKSDIEKPERAFELLDWLSSDEGHNFCVNGIEGIHYTMQDGKMVPNKAEIEKQVQDYMAQFE